MMNKIITKFRKWMDNRCSIDRDLVSAYNAFSKSAYGEVINHEVLIKYHKCRINNMIKDKINFASKGSSFDDYYVTYSFTDDVKPYIDDILEPFRKNGYDVRYISRDLYYLSNTNTYMIIWYKKNL